MKIIANVILTRILFVDDVLIFLTGAISDTIVLNNNLKFFCKATGMDTNQEISTLSTMGCT